jgi:hypothetical protein
VRDLWRSLCIGLFVVVAFAGAYAQQLPDAPGALGLRSEVTPATEMLREPSTRVADKKFWTLTVAHFAATYADATTSSLGVGRHSCGPETNAIYGKYPSPQRFFLQMSAETAAISAFDYFLKRRHSRFWFVAGAADATTHAWAAAMNANRCSL